MQRRTAGHGLGAVLFTDIVGSTPIAAEMGNTRWGELVARHHRILRQQIGRFGGREVDTAGDGFFVVFERPADAIRCAVAATEAVRQLGIEVRAGVAFGELEMAGPKPSGLVVNTASRVMSVGGPGEVLVPASVREIVSGAGITFAEHGVHRLTGLEDEFRLFSVTGVDGIDVAQPQDAEQAAERRREIFPAGGRRRGPLIAGLAAALLALLVGGWALLSGGPDETEKKEAGPLQNAVVRIDADSGRIRSSIRLSRNSGRTGLTDRPIVAGEGGVWVLDPPALLHIDPIHEEVRNDQITIGLANRVAVATGLDAVWVIGGQNNLYRVNPATDEVEPFLVVHTQGSGDSSLAVGDFVWVGTTDGTLIRLDPGTGARDQVDTGLSIDLLAATRKSVWAVDLLESSVIRVDPGSFRRVGRPIHTRGSIDQIVASDDYVWLLDRGVGVLTRIDAATGAVKDSVRVGNEASDLAVGLDYVWVGDRGGSLFRVDPSTLQVREFSIGAEVLGVAVDETAESVWVYLGKPTG